MKRLFLTIAIVLCSIITANAQHSTYYYQRASLFEQLPTSKNDIIFLGNSITDGGEWAEILANKNVKNRGISGDVTQGVLDRLETVTKGKPLKLFLLIGINDLAYNVTANDVRDNILKIVAQIKAESPKTEIFVQSILPVSDHFDMFGGHTSKTSEIMQINSQLEDVASTKGFTYIDLYSHFVDSSTERLNIKYSNDGLHLLGAGYMLWAEILKPYMK